jgi:type I restriction-modification system DNA methylase subunit
MVQLRLEKIPEWIESNIKQQKQPEADPNEVVSVLRQTARRLNDELEAAPEENLFRNVLGATPEEDEEEKQAARETAGFLLVNQITFYRVLSAHKDFPEIDPEDLQSPADLAEYFELVLDYDYTPVFSFEIVNDLPQESLSTLRDAIKSIYALSPERITHDILGKVFHELIPVSARKKVAAYYTKNKAADVLANLAIDDADARVMDPACGSGTLLAASYIRKRELTHHFTETDHRRFVEKEITGIDVMPFAAHLSCIHLALQAPVFETDEVNIGIEDSTTLEPGRTISPLSFVLPEASEQRGLHEYEEGKKPDVSEEMIEGGSVAMDAVSGQEMELGSVDVVIMNPPYSRQESVARFAEGYKNRLRDRFDRRDSKGQIHGKMSFCSYFMFLADKFLKPGGRIAAVLPASMLNKTTDSGVRQMLMEEYHIKHLVTRTDQSNLSEDTDMREMLVVAEKKEGHSSEAKEESTAYTTLNGLNEVDPDDIRHAVGELRQGEIKSSQSVTQKYDHESLTTRLIPEEELEEHNLFGPFTVQNHELFDLWGEVTSQDNFVQLEELEDPWLTGGIGFGGNAPDCKEAILNQPDAALKNNDIWVTREENKDSVEAEHRFINESVKIPRENLIPAFHRFTRQARLDLSDLPEYAVVNTDFNQGERFTQLGELEYPKKRWQELTEKRLSHLGLLRRVDLTASGLRHLAYYSSEPRLYHGMMFCLPGLEQSDGRNLSLWLDSSLNLLQMLVSRIPSRGGWTEYHRNTVAKFYVPDPLAIEESEERHLRRTFEEVGNVEFPSIAEQMIQNTPEEALTTEERERLKSAFPDLHNKLGDGFDARRKMDRAVLDVSGISKERHDDILALLYPALLKELVALKLMME